MMTSLFESLSRNTAMLELVAKKNSPKVLFVGGVVGMVGSTVLACRATLKVEEVLHEAQSDLKVAGHIQELHPDHYSVGDQKRDSAIVYVRSVGRVAKLYAPAVGLGVVSIAALTKSHNILQERNAALMAAYAALDKGFREYRARVVDKYGEDQDRQFRYETETVAEGSKGGKTKTVTRVGPGGASIYAKFFDEYSSNWNSSPEINRVFLKCQQNCANDMLHARGHLFLNEVYQMLDLPHTKAGAIVGWVSGEEGVDNYVDFGIFHADGSDSIRDFMNGREGSVLLDFNVDGVIFDKIESTKEAISWRR